MEDDHCGGGDGGGGLSEGRVSRRFPEVEEVGYSGDQEPFQRVDTGSSTLSSNEGPVGTERARRTKSVSDIGNENAKSPYKVWYQGRQEV